jgi:hypothetical protein
MSGTHLDPGLVEAFLPIAAQLHATWFPPEESGARGARAMSAS